LQTYLSAAAECSPVIELSRKRHFVISAAR
jgi:hypothetical protein